MGTNTVTVSIVMPAYNAAKTIAESIESVLAQTFTAWELVIVDDGSTDNTREIIEQFTKKDSRVILLSHVRNSGLPSARNSGCKIANGNLVAFLDSDDLWSPEKLSTQIEFHSKNPKIEISHTDFHAFNERGKIKRPFKNVIESKTDKKGNIYPHVCYKNPIGVLTVMVKKNILEEVNFFDSTLWTMEDHDLWVRIAKRGHKFGYLDRDLASYRITGSGITSKTGKYKKAYKRFIEKMKTSEDISVNLLLRHYYRHFGTVYFKNNKYRLARLYFSKSIALFPFDLIAFSTSLYLVITFGQQLAGLDFLGKPVHKNA